MTSCPSCPSFLSRPTLALCEFEDLSYAEAAQAMGCSVKSVELRIYRAKQTLREKLRRLL